MATKRWRGDAPLVAQVSTVTITAYDATTTYKVTINGKTVSVLGSGGTTSTVATALQTALAASTIPEFLEMTWTVLTNVVTGTANGTGNLLGKPITISTSVSGGTGTISGATTTTASGPNDISIAANWAGAALPVDGDDVVFDYGSSDVLYNLDQNGVTPATITTGAGFSGKIGLPDVNADNAAYPYYEYRQKYLKYGNSGDAQTVTVTIQGGGGRIKIDNGTAQAVWNVQASTQRTETLIPQVLLLGTHASNALTVSKGDVGVAFFAGETSTLLSLNVGYQKSVASDAKVFLGSGVTLTAPTIVQTGGNLTVNSAITSTSVVTIYDGIYTQVAGGIAAGLSVLGGQCIYNSTGTLGGAPVVGGGILDFSQDLRAKTVTNPIDLYGEKSQILDPNKVVATMVVDLDQITNSTLVNLGKNIRLTRGAVA